MPAGEFQKHLEGMHRHEGVFWDAGLVYRDAHHGFRSTCVPATKAMMAYWALSEGGLPLLSSLTVRLSLYLSLSHLFEAADSSLVSRMKVNKIGRAHV